MADLGALDLAAIDRELVARQGFYRYVKLVWSQIETSPFVDGWHIEALCGVLDRVARGDLKRVVINIPPGTGKSLITSVFFPAYQWLLDPSHKFMCASFDHSLTLRDARRTIDLVTSPWHVARWPALRLASAAPAAGEHSTTARGWRFSTSIGGKATGWHPNTRIIDDPHKPAKTQAEALTISDADLARVREWYANTWSTRRADPANLREILIMQRLHMQDLSQDRLDAGYEHVCLPMRYESGHASQHDKRTIEGDLLDPVRYPEHVVTELETALGDNAAAQLQQRPVAKVGNIVQREWIRRYEEIPVRKIIRWIQSWDLTFKDSGTSRVCGDLWGYAPDMGWLLVDSVVKRMGYAETKAEILRRKTGECARGEYWKRATVRLVEAKANGPAIQSELGNLVTLVEPNGSKLERLAACQPQFQAGRVWHPMTLSGASISEREDNLCFFPRGRGDDEVDTTTQLLLWAAMHGSTLARAMKAIQ